MHPLQKQFHDFINQKDLITRSDKVLLAVSGGMDSMVLADLLLKSNFDFSVAHCNFGLRGKESDEDEKLVREWATENNISCFVKKFKLEGTSIQLAARNARYLWFDKLIQDQPFDKLITAHHLNDSLETTLINLTRGTGIKGIVGIQPTNGIKIRPLLFASKEELRKYAQETRLKWREDSSNSKNDYDRNLIRNEVVPNLKELNPSLIETFKNTSERLQLTNLLLQEKVEEVKTTCLNQENGLFELKTDWINNSSDQFILSEIVAQFGFNYVTSKKIFNALGKSGKIFNSTKHQITVDRSSIFISENESVRTEKILIRKEGQYEIDDKKILVSILDRKEVELSSDKHIVHLDASKISFPHTVRRWKQGDRFQPLGMEGSKKVSDYLIDRKVPVALKDQIMVMTNEDNIVWLIGHQISEGFKISPTTKTALRVEITNL